MKKVIAIADPRIKEFCELVNRGVEAWSKAGTLLCEIRADNPNAYSAIISANPWVTRDVLETFERIGSKQIYPYLLVDGSYGATRLASFPYEQQEKLYHSSVLVAVRKKGTIAINPKRVSDLSAGEAARVFDVDRVRTPDEQRALLRSDRVHSVRFNAEAEFERALQAAANQIEKANECLRQIETLQHLRPAMDNALAAIDELRAGRILKTRPPDPGGNGVIHAGSFKLTPAAEALISGKRMPAKKAGAAA